MINKQSYQIQGMKQDNLVNTGFSSKFAHEIMNMRLNTIGDYTTASWTTEKGTKKIVVNKMFNPKHKSNKDLYYTWITDKIWHDSQLEPSSGTYNIEDFKPIGQAIINNEWILFGVVSNKDELPENLTNYIPVYSVILNLHYDYDTNDEESLYGRILYWGNLNFQQNYPIETLTFYENEKLQKVYWTDGLNQLRVINIKGAEGKIDGFNSEIVTQFDFTQEVSLNEKVKITKNQSGLGLFPPGTVKYAITYYKEYGQETNVVYDSHLYYPTISERGCGPDELSGDSFDIEITNLDLTHGFDYIRLYSIIKTTNNATPIVRIVDDKKLPTVGNSSSKITFHDTNTTGRIIDPSIIYFLGGKEIIAHTLDQKDNTLFLGNIVIKTKSVTKLLDETGQLNKINNNATDEEMFCFVENVKDLAIREQKNDNSVYQWINQLNQNKYYIINTETQNTETPEIEEVYAEGNSQYIKHFKFGECYRFGIQFQDDKGVWSEVIFLGDKSNDIRPNTNNDNNVCKFAGIKYILPKSVIDVLVGNHYKKARLVCCYPNNANRSVIAQGVIAPTVYNNKWKGSHTPDVMSSWFFRPNDKINGANNFDCHVLPWKHEDKLDSVIKINDLYYIIPEVQSTHQLNGHLPIIDWDTSESVYRVDRSVMTFHSPEIEFDESLRTLPFDNWEIFIIGKVPINSYAAKYYVNADLTAKTPGGTRRDGLSKEFEKQTVRLIGPNSTWVGSHFPALGEWKDTNLYTKKDDMRDDIPYCIYPFHRKGSLNNYIKNIDTWKYNKDGDEGETKITKSAELHSKCLSHILYSTTSVFYSDETEILSKDSKATFNIFDSNEVLPLKLKDTDGNDLIYYGNVNNISPIGDSFIKTKLVGYDEENNINVSGTYPIGYYFEREYGKIKYNFDGVKRIQRDSRTPFNTDGVFAVDPVPITYKSTPHGVFYTNEDTATDTTDYPFLYLTEIRRKVEKPFGDNSTTDKQNTIYIPCGDPISLTDDQNYANFNNDKYLYGLEGDTYYMRYDNLKTYPYASDDTNQIVEILSFMCETRVNLDGRYDKNRGLLDNTMITNTNFGLVNKSYTQDNNTFTFLTLDKMATELDNFANQLTWTNPKVSGEDVDAWTNITLASTADANGTLGAINKIINLNDNLYLFQDHGVAKISFNENTAISTENGVPLELAKTGKFTGLDYLSTEIGCQNKWSISSTKNGVFFIDDSRQELLTLSEGFTSLSTIHGFDAFMINQLPSTFKSWNPLSFDNFVTYYDKLSNDVYYINKDVCLAWNEQSKTFTSFYNYENTPYMMNVGQHSLMWHNGVWAAREADTYSTFFNTTKDYSMTIVCDGQTDNGSAFPADKVFNNIEYRADIYNLDGTNTNYSTSIFNIKQAWNGYQDSGDCALDGIRKFNTWRVQLPRHQGTRDRIRNPFCYIKLKQYQLSSTQTNRVILHDLAVYFDMR